MQWSMEIWRSEWDTTIQMQPLKTRVWRAIYRNKNRFCGFYVGKGTSESLKKLLLQTMSALTAIFPMKTSLE